MSEDTYLTLAAPAQSRLTEKMSRFLAFVHPASTSDEAKAIIKSYRDKYHDARHVCWAYMLGPARTEWQLNDNGEPSGTAGKPILGQINSHGLTDVVAVVVRYFGGIKLGTPGLTAAYREATRMALEEARIEERYETVGLRADFSYMDMNGVMKAVKAMNLKVVSQDFDNACSLTVVVRKSQADEARRRLEENAQVTEI